MSEIADLDVLDTPEEAQHAKSASLPEDVTVIDRENAPVETFLVELERQMLTGHSPMSRRNWARTQGVEGQSFRRYEEIIRGTWAVEGTTHFALQQRRDELRQMYRQIWFEAMNPGDVVTKSGDVVDGAPDLMVALKTIDSLAKLDGLVMPDVAVQINNAAAAERVDQTRAQLTNKTRERTMQLLQTARERAERHALKTTRAITEKSETESFEVPSQKVMGVVR